MVLWDMPSHMERFFEELTFSTPYALAPKFRYFYGGQKIKFSFPFYFGVFKIRPDEGIQIRSQNSNPITFDTLLTKQRSKTGKSGAYFASSSTGFSHKEGQVLSDLNFATRFGILSSRRIF